jgi:hydroxycarboxylate dehydrogenase A
LDTISVHGAPSEYILEEGILNTLEDKLIQRGLKKLLIIHGGKSWQAVKNYWPTFQTIAYQEYTYAGECSLSEIKKVTDIVSGQSFDAIIGVGGGKVLDLTKAVSHVTHKPSILIPTLASNCSPWTPISVIYDDSGTFFRFDIYPVSASLVLIDPIVLLHAPIKLLIAGIGDTLAKWYEADVQMSKLSNPSVPLQISHYTARLCKDLLLQHSEAAIHAVKVRALNEEFIKVVETIIMLGGMVGGFGDHYGRVAGAHAIHNGLTVLEETHHALHGEKVAYGILVQLALEDKWNEINQLLPFYQMLELPTKLNDLGVKFINEKVFEDVAIKATVPTESIHVMPIGKITPERVSKAMAQLEEDRRNKH